MVDSNFYEQYPELKEKIILNVDDNEMNQLVISKIMNNAGITTIPAINGSIAIAKLNEGLIPDVILLDLEMPVLNGLQTAEIIRNEFDQQIPIIINSGSVSAFERWKLKKLGIKEFLEKPYSMKDIFSKISRSIMHLQA